MHEDRGLSDVRHVSLITQVYAACRNKRGDEQTESLQQENIAPSVQKASEGKKPLPLIFYCYLTLALKIQPDYIYRKYLKGKCWT